MQNLPQGSTGTGGRHGPSWDIADLERVAQQYFTGGLAEGTRRAYKSAARCYARFCGQYRLPLLPLTEQSSCLFATYLAKRGLSPGTVSSYLAATRFLQITAGMGQPPRENWPRLHYVVRGIKRLQADSPHRTRLPITADVLLTLGRTWSAGSLENPYNALLLWAACCLGYFGFLRAGEFTATSGVPPSIRLADVSVDSNTAPSVLKVHLRKAKTDPFGKGVDLFLGKTGAPLCPVAAMLKFLGVRSKEDGPLFILEGGAPLSRDLLVKKVRRALESAGLDQSQYTGHSFRIGAATSAAAAGVPAHIIKMMGRWSSEAYMLYIQTPRESLASVSVAIAK